MKIRFICTNYFRGKDGLGTCDTECQWWKEGCPCAKGSDKWDRKEHYTERRCEMKTPRELIGELLNIDTEYNGVAGDTCIICGFPMSKKTRLEMIEKCLAQLEEYYKPKDSGVLKADEVTLEFFRKYLKMPKANLEDLCRECKRLKATPLEPIDEKCKRCGGKIVDEKAEIDGERVCILCWDKFGVSNKLEMLDRELITAINDMLGGHYNLYKKVFGEDSNPEDDICRKQLMKFGSPTRGKDI